MDFTTLKEKVTQNWRGLSEWREQARDDFAFVAGHQWSSEERAQMTDAQRVPIVFNRTAVILSAVAGAEINNRTEVRFIPREIGDAKVNEVLSAGGEWFRDQADAEDTDSEAFWDLLVCGIGATDATLDFDEDPEGRPEIVRLDPVMCGWEQRAYRKGLRDSNIVFAAHELSAEDAESRFEGKRASEIHCDWLPDVNSAAKSRNEIGDEYKGESESIDEDSLDTVIVVQVQWCERERLVEFVDPMGQRQEVSAAKWERIKGTLPMLPPHRELRKKVWRQAFLGRFDILAENQPDPHKPTINFMTGMRDTKEKMFYGLLRSMRDPQKYANKWLSQSLHILGANAKGGVMYEAGAVDDPEAFEENWSRADSATQVNDGALSAGKIQEKPSANMPAAHMALTEFAVSSIRDASGVNMELLGLRDANQPGILEYQRRQSAITTLAKFFDAVRYYRKRQGETILHFLREHIAPTGRMARIVKGEDVQYIPLALADDTRTYDVIVDDAPQAPNEKEKSWSVIQAMMPMLQNANLSMDDWADILEYSPLPASFVEKVRMKAQEQNKQPDPRQELAIKKEMSEIRENESNAKLDEIKARQIAAEMNLASLQGMLGPQQEAAPALAMGYV